MQGKTLGTQANIQWSTPWSFQHWHQHYMPCSSLWHHQLDYRLHLHRIRDQHNLVRHYPNGMFKKVKQWARHCEGFIWSSTCTDCRAATSYRLEIRPLPCVRQLIDDKIAEPALFTSMPCRLVAKQVPFHTWVMCKAGPGQRYDQRHVTELNGKRKSSNRCQRKWQIWNKINQWNLLYHVDRMKKGIKAVDFWQFHNWRIIYYYLPLNHGLRMQNRSYTQNTA